MSAAYEVSTLWLLKERSSREEVAMTTQHAPHTPPLWRRFLSLPHTRLGWWAVGLATVGLASIALIAFVALVDIELEHTVNPPWLGAVLDILLLITVLVAPLGGLVVGSLALGAGERSMLVWAALVPSAVFFVGLATIFQEGYIWVKASIGVLFWAVITFSLIYLSQGVHSRRSGATDSRGRSS
jgi:hypothetical protein